MSVVPRPAASLMMRSTSAGVRKSYLVTQRPRKSRGSAIGTGLAGSGDGGVVVSAEAVLTPCAADGNSSGDVGPGGADGREASCESGGLLSHAESSAATETRQAVIRFMTIPGRPDGTGM